MPVETRWWLCPNRECEHGNIFHDVESLDDERPTCCVDGCPCGHTKETADAGPT